MKTLWIKFCVVCTLVLFFSSGSYYANASTYNIPIGVRSGVVGYWTLDGKDMNWGTGQAFDSSGQSATGTMVSFSTTTSPVMGKIGQALTFNGTSQYINVPNVSELNSATLRSTVTLSAWIYPTSVAQSFNAILLKGSSVNWNYHLQLTTNRILWSTTNASNVSDDLTSNATLTTNRWYHIAVTYDSVSGTKSIYINGVLDRSTAVSGLLRSNTSPLGLGVFNDVGSFSRYFHGTLDDLRIYNRAISVIEVRNLYNMGGSKMNSGTQGLTSGSALATNLLGLWTFDGKDTNWTTNRTSDLSGQGNTGSLIGFSTTTSPVVGKIGQALIFNGSTSYVPIGNSPLNTSAPLGYAVSAWFMTSASSGYVFERGFDEPSISIGSGNVFCLTKNGAGTQYSISGSFSSGKWNHIVCTVDPATGVFRIYVNGVSVSSTAVTSGDTLRSQQVSAIGRRGSAGGTYFNGQLDDVRFYGRNLTATDVKQLYNLGNSTANASSQNLTGATSLTSGLVGLWSFDGKDMNWSTMKATDRSGGGNSGQLTNMATSSAPAVGKVGQSLMFNGSSQYIDVPYSVSLAPASLISFGAWFKTNNAGQVNQPIISKTEAGGYSLYLNGNSTYFTSCSGTLCALVRTSGPVYTAVAYTIPSFTANTWYHAFVTYDGVTVRLYLNGVLVANDNGSGGIPYSSSNNLCIGSEAGSSACGVADPTYRFNGALDEVRVYNRALSAGEVKQLYLVGK